MKHAASRLFALIRNLFSHSSREVVKGSNDATIWRMAPPGEKVGNNPVSDSDVDFVRIYPAKRRGE